MVDISKHFNSMNSFESSEPAEMAHSSLIKASIASLLGNSADAPPSQINKFPS